jgi:hypothetical protein
MERSAIEIVDFPMKNGGSFHSLCESLPEGSKNRGEIYIYLWDDGRYWITLWIFQCSELSAIPKNELLKDVIQTIMKSWSLPAFRGSEIYCMTLGHF